MQMLYTFWYLLEIKGLHTMRALPQIIAGPSNYSYNMDKLFLCLQQCWCSGVWYGLLRHLEYSEVVQDPILLQYSSLIFVVAFSCPELPQPPENLSKVCTFVLRIFQE